MAHRIGFHFQPGSSPLHGWDARCKFFAMAALTLGLFRMHLPGLTTFTLVMILAVAVSGIPLKSFLRDLRTWAFLLTAIFILQAVFHPSTDYIWSSAIPLTRTGLEQASLTCWRLTLILCFATLFTLTTRPKDLQDAITWLLRPFPFIPARRVALMVSLMLRFLPLILEQADEIRMAMKSRLGHERKNPLRKIQWMALPIFRKSVVRADQLALALTARGYREDLPLRLPSLPRSHLLTTLLFVLLVLCGTPPATEALAARLPVVLSWVMG